MERKVLKLLFNKEFYSKIRSIINPDEFSPFGQDTLKYIDEFYDNDAEALHIDHDLLIKNLELGLAPKHKEMAANVVYEILQEDISEVNLAELVIKLKKSKVAAELSNKLLANDEGAINKLLTEYQELDAKVHDIFNGETEYNAVPIIESLDLLEHKNRIPLYPRSLNEVLGGGAIRGQNILVFGRPEIGKTLFLINLIGGFLIRGYKVLYIGNEDPIELIIPRIHTRLSEMSIDEIRSNKERASEKIFERGYSNLYLKSVHPGTWNEIKEAVDRIKPDVLVVDQLRHLYCGNLSKVEQMERVAVEARNVAKKYNILCVGVTQAGDSAENKAVLEMGDVDFSNTGMQGAMDLIIGIGANEDMINQNRRMLSLPKNKITGDHRFIPVQYNIPINKVESL